MIMKNKTATKQNTVESLTRLLCLLTATGASEKRLAALRAELALAAEAAKKAAA